MSKYYGMPPEVVTNIQCDVDEMMFYLYMPIWMPDEGNRADMADNIPQRLYKPFRMLFEEAIEHSFVHKGDRFDYWYVTAKRLYVTPENMGNRPGWHSDGYGTSDVNYIWSDTVPTEFCSHRYEGLSSDHSEALRQMEEMSRGKSVFVREPNTLIRLDQYNIHRAPSPLHGFEGIRTFFKLTGSNSRFNLKGNSHNYLMNYDWPMFDRGEERNMESRKVA